MTDKKQQNIINALDLIEKGIRDKSKTTIQNGFDLIDNIVSIEWNEIPELGNRYNILVDSIANLKL